MKVTELDNITGSLSKPSKMPGYAYGLPAKECKTGKKLPTVLLDEIVTTLGEKVAY